MNQYEAIDAVYPPYTPPSQETRLITGKTPQLESNPLGDTGSASEKGDSTIQRYWSTINDAYDGV